MLARTLLLVLVESTATRVVRREPRGVSLARPMFASGGSLLPEKAVHAVVGVERDRRRGHLLHGLAAPQSNI